MKKNILLSFCLFCFTTIQAQVPTVQDCLGAIPVCQQIYSEDQSLSGNGNYQNEINTSISCTAGEISSTWYTFTVNNSGDFGFLITPNNINDDYDWALFNLTNAPCDAIGNDPSIVESCNAAGGGNCNGLTGATGATNETNQGGGCSNGNSPLNALIPVVQGNTYVLMVSNWSESPFGYELDFGLSGDIGIFDEIDPSLDEIEVDDICNISSFDIEFSEYIQCNSIDESNFQVDAPGGPFTLSLSANTCDAGGAYDRYFTLTIAPSINITGEYFLEFIGDGVSDALDLCGNPSLSTSQSFTVENALSVVVELGTDTTICEGESLLLDASGETLEYLWQDGSSSSSLMVTEAGNYAVTVTDLCNNTATDEINVSFILTPILNLDDQIVICNGDTQTLDVSNENATYLWQDGSTDPTFTITEAGVYAVTVTNECQSLTGEIEAFYTDPTVIELGEDQTLCPNDTVFYDLNSLGATYIWQDGSTNPSYTITATGNYSVTVTTPCDTLIDDVNITFIPPIELELGMDTYFCNGAVTLDATQSFDVEYIWQDRSTKSTFLVTEAGEYIALLYSDCETVSDTINLMECEQCEVFYPNIFSPNADGFNDAFRPMTDCVLNDYSLLVFDRWGAKIFESTNPSDAWDGRYRGSVATEGVYVWVAEFTVIENGVTRPVTNSGDLMLMR